MSDRPALAYLGLGSNLDGPLRQLHEALTAIRHLPTTRLCRISRWYRSTPLGPGPQPDYINGVAQITTGLRPLQLLRELQTIETRQGRQRTLRWGARTLDLDILLYDDLRLTTPELTIPHPQMALRNFVLRPLADIAPSLILPDGTPLAGLLANVSPAGIVPLAEI